MKLVELSNIINSLVLQTIFLKSFDFSMLVNIKSPNILALMITGLLLASHWCSLKL